MNLALLMLLGLLWSVVLLPSALRSRRQSLHHSMGGFSRAMQVLGGGESTVGRDRRAVLVPANAARIVAPPRGVDLARERRRRALTTLLVCNGIAWTLGLLVGGVFSVLAWMATLSLAAFVAALRNLAVRDRRRRDLVRLDERRARAEVGARSAEVGRTAVGI